MLLLLLVVKGWTITCQSLQWTTRLILGSVWAAYSTASTALFVWNQVIVITASTALFVWNQVIVITARNVLFVWNQVTPLILIIMLICVVKLSAEFYSQNAYHVVMQ